MAKVQKGATSGQSYLRGGRGGGGVNRGTTRGGSTRGTGRGRGRGLKKPDQEDHSFAQGAGSVRDEHSYSSATTSKTGKSGQRPAYQVSESGKAHRKGLEAKEADRKASGSESSTWERQMAPKDKVVKHSIVDDDPYKTGGKRTRPLVRPFALRCVGHEPGGRRTPRASATGVSKWQ